MSKIRLSDSGRFQSVSQAKDYDRTQVMMSHARQVSADAVKLDNMDGVDLNSDPGVVVIGPSDLAALCGREPKSDSDFVYNLESNAQSLHCRFDPETKEIKSLNLQGTDRDSLSLKPRKEKSGFLGLFNDTKMVYRVAVTKREIDSLYNVRIDETAVSQNGDMDYKILTSGNPSRDRPIFF